MRKDPITATELLDLAKAKTGSDAATARFLEAAQQNIVQIRKGTRPFTGAQVLKLCDLCDLDFPLTLASLIAEREQDLKTREMMRKKSEPLSQGF